MKNNIKNLFIGGLAATSVMTMVMVMAPHMGMPKMPIGEMLAGFLGLPVAIGWGLHFMMGIMIAAPFVLFLKDRIPGNSTTKGIIYALIPFLMAQLVVMPMMGAGVFSMNTPVPVMMVMGSLIGHLVYGAVLGTLVGKLEGSAAPVLGV